MEAVDLTSEALQPMTVMEADARLLDRKGQTIELMGFRVVGPSAKDVNFGR
jgi:hypothetical protein